MTLRLTRTEAGFNKDGHVLELDYDNVSGTDFDNFVSPTAVGLSISGASTRARKERPRKRREGRGRTATVTVDLQSFDPSIWGLYG